MATPLALTDDVADLWRPLTAVEAERALHLIEKASGLLRQRVPWVDARMVRFRVDSADPGGLDPVVVATVVAGVVKRYLSNVMGVASETTGPYSVTYAIRGEKDPRGELVVTDGDLERLLPATKTPHRIGTIKSHARLAPWPYGSVGASSGAGGSSTDLWLLEDMGGPGELPYLPSHDSAS